MLVAIWRCSGGTLLHPLRRLVLFGADTWSSWDSQYQLLTVDVTKKCLIRHITTYLFLTKSNSIQRFLGHDLPPEYTLFQEQDIADVYRMSYWIKWELKRKNIKSRFWRSKSRFEGSNRDFGLQFSKTEKFYFDSTICICANFDLRSARFFSLTVQDTQSH